MGSSSSKNKIDLKSNNKVTIAITQCLNYSLYEKFGVSKYSGKTLRVSVEYNGQKQQVSAHFTKCAIFEKGVVQFDRVDGCTSFKLTLASDCLPQWDSIEVQLAEDQVRQTHKLTLKGSGKSDDQSDNDGADSCNPDVDICLFYSFNVSELIQYTRSKNNVASYINTEALDQVEEGDIILYSGEGKLSNLIKNRFYRPYSHVGIVIKTYPQIVRGSQPIDTPQLYIMESVGPGEGGDPFRQKQSISGVTFFPLIERIKEYEGHSVQHLKLAQPMTPIQRERFINSCFSMHGARLPFDVIQASVLLFERLKLWNIQSNHSVFCSELIAIVLHQAGLITDERYSPSNTDPGEVSDYPCFNKDTLKFLKYDI